MIVHDIDLTGLDAEQYAKKMREVDDLRKSLDKQYEPWTITLHRDPSVKEALV